MCVCLCVTTDKECSITYAKCILQTMSFIKRDEDLISKSFILFKTYFSTNLPTVQDVNVDEVRVGVRRRADVLARIGAFGPLDQQVRGGRFALFRDNRYTAPG